ncbi:hypothetical protein TI10_22365 [Photorhabdus luminescens subsp. luminescens]|uniref:Uncharacterized protein n=1 Tax=Photorhabdus luminescens TaxID=29488 RepID=A0A1G5QHH8_PHOLU|nr:hypothetical protein [Photorhabdus luminescens]KMW71142.1 hypothetical protein TI10_22365 [Photorhabdus luminescens subsp. luminescens]SCZ61152.1 hypothetical protein SAMN02982990_01667 [Photorhabdus luminescens]
MAKIHMVAVNEETFTAIKNKHNDILCVANILTGDAFPHADSGDFIIVCLSKESEEYSLVLSRRYTIRVDEVIHCYTQGYETRVYQYSLLTPSYFFNEGGI